MTIDKAIEILSIATGEREFVTDYDYFDAQKLGLAALIRFKVRRLGGHLRLGTLLPGETKE